MYEPEKSGFGITLHFKLFPPNSGFVRLWAEISTIALIFSILTGYFREVASTIFLIWLGLGVGKFLLKLFPTQPKKI